MLNACPNQKIPSNIMNISGRTAAASAVSVAGVSRASLRNALHARLIVPIIVVLIIAPRLGFAQHHTASRRAPTLLRRVPSGIQDYRARLDGREVGTLPERRGCGRCYAASHGLVLCRRSGSPPSFRLRIWTRVASRPVIPGR